MKFKIAPALFAICSLAVAGCGDRPEIASKPQGELSGEELIARGKYLTTVSLCHDCHSPKIMTPFGPEPDTTRLLSGHPAGEVLPTVLNTGDWILFSNGLTAVVGPWGISYAANLTPDDTGLGNWKYEQFVTALRKGKYKGLEGNRSLLPPMPWQMIGNMSDDDLKAIFTYLQSLPPVENLVPAPVSPEKLSALSKSNTNK